MTKRGSFHSVFYFASKTEETSEIKALLFSIVYDTTFNRWLSRPSWIFEIAGKTTYSQNCEKPGTSLYLWALHNAGHQAEAQKKRDVCIPGTSSFRSLSITGHLPAALAFAFLAFFGAFTDFTGLPASDRPGTSSAK